MQTQVTGGGRRDSDNSRDGDRLRWAERSSEAQLYRDRERRRSGEGGRESRRQAASGSALGGNKTPVRSISLQAEISGDARTPSKQDG